jgi:Ni,Fe-hydrogenase III large subunit
VLGYVGRASGIDIDARRDHPYALSRPQLQGADLFVRRRLKARTEVRVEEVRRAGMPSAAGRSRSHSRRAAAAVRAFGIVEGWRGRIVHWIMTGDGGRLHRVKIVDPSFFNWPALSYALEGNIVPDFPLCNKSFNQSYSGNDL